VIVKILSHLGLSTRTRPVRQLVEWIYFKRSEEPNRLPTQAAIRNRLRTC
jgi:hypothetical protein